MRFLIRGATLILLIISSFLLFLFLNSALEKLFLILVTLTLFFILISFKKERENIGGFAFPNVVGYINLISFFSFTLVLLFWQLEFQVQLVYPLIALILLNFFLTSLSFKAYGLSFRNSLFYVIIIDLLVSEIFWAVNFWPGIIYTQAAIVTLVYYLLVGITRQYLVNGFASLTFKVLERYLFISIAGILILLLTSRWR